MKIYSIGVRGRLMIIFDKKVGNIGGQSPIHKKHFFKIVEKSVGILFPVTNSPLTNFEGVPKFRPFSIFFLFFRYFGRVYGVHFPLRYAGIYTAPSPEEFNYIITFWIFFIFPGCSLRFVEIREIFTLRIPRHYAWENILKTIKRNEGILANFEIFDLDFSRKSFRCESRKIIRDLYSPPQFWHVAEVSKMTKVLEYRIENG